MEAIIINEHTDNNGIFISPEVLSKFNTRKIQISIKEVDKSINKKELMKFAGIISETEADELLANIKECRTIDNESWQ